MFDLFSENLEWRVGFAFRVASFAVCKSDGRGSLLILGCGTSSAFFFAGHFLVVFGWFCITLVCLLCRGKDSVQNDALDASVAAHTAEKVFPVLYRFVPERCICKVVKARTT